ncbi:MAG: TetR family transcriptional regulator [Glaciihabitans sp.]|nr:TetR family transcriptional regulator [Glaciihabitans sp.]
MSAPGQVHSQPDTPVRLYATPVQEISKSNRGPSAGPENRRALVTAAREIFAEEGFLAPLSAVAKRAGVGQGSLYRHFPDRMALAVAVFDDNITELERFAASETSTLVDLFDHVAEQALGSTALIDMLTANLHDPRAEHLSDRLSALVSELLARDRASGRVATSVTQDDVLLAVNMMAVVLARTDPENRPEVATRARAIFRSAFTHTLPMS